MLSAIFPSPLPLITIQLVVFLSSSKNQAFRVAPSFVGTFSSLYTIPYLSGFTLYSRLGLRADTERATAVISRMQIIFFIYFYSEFKCSENTKTNSRKSCGYLQL